MCARFKQVKDPSALKGLIDAPQLPNYPFNPNVAPTEESPIVIGEGGKRELRMARFGMVPSWAKDKAVGVKYINARAETVHELPAFRSAFRERRCLIPVAGFYEWREESGKKQPYLFSRADDLPLVFAGLWDRWQGQDEAFISFTILTTEPNRTVAPYHNRMPVVLADAEYDSWLSTGSTDLLDPCPDDLLACRKVNPAMNNPRMKDPAAIDRAPDQLSLF